MIDPVLKKFELSQARKSIRNLSNNSLNMVKRLVKHKSSCKKSKDQTMVETQPSSDIINQSNKKENKLQCFIRYLRTHNGCLCRKHAEQYYRVKFICLQQSCVDNFGCAECLIYKHSNHRTAEISTCLRDFEQLNTLMNQSYDLIISQKMSVKKQITEQIALEIKNMQEAFHQSMIFFKNKALKQIDNYLYSQYKQLQILTLLRHDSQLNILNINENESHLVSQILKIDISQIQHNLNNKLTQLSLEKIDCQLIVKLFEEMNGTLCQVMAQFKTCFPKIYRKQPHDQPNQSTDLFSINKLNHNSQIISQFQSGYKEKQSQFDNKTEYTHF